MKKIKYGNKRYYHDELNDDFAGTHIKAKKIPNDYPYLRTNFFYKLWSFSLYYIIAVPVLRLIGFFTLSVRVHGKKNLRKIKTGAITYANHCHNADGTNMAAFVCFPRRMYIIANPDAVSIPFVRHLTVALGALPLPTELKGYEHFLVALDTLLKRRKIISIYPEAHIWPYYTGIRNFPATSFVYAARFNVPAVPVVSTFRQPKGLLKDYRRPCMDIHIGAPIYPDANLTNKENAKIMRDKTFDFMKSYADKPDNIALYDYQKLSEGLTSEK
ncbi:MAG: lysophospholipid acyltransferase family protein [Firmicutes bacterium]|nr:lysophospholipid acyltransferase family protein [Bacillota bacterium]